MSLIYHFNITSLVDAQRCWLSLLFESSNSLNFVMSFHAQFYVKQIYNVTGCMKSNNFVNVKSFGKREERKSENCRGDVCDFLLFIH